MSRYEYLLRNNRCIQKDIHNHDIFRQEDRLMKLGIMLMQFFSQQLFISCLPLGPKPWHLGGLTKPYWFLAIWKVGCKRGFPEASACGAMLVALCECLGNTQSEMLSLFHFLNSIAQ